jgi:hypothetical protein
MQVSRSLSAAVLLCVLPLAACGPSHRLGDFTYTSRTLAVVSQVPRRPEVLSGPLFPDLRGDPVRDFLRIGSQVVREVEARAVRERLDSAASRIDVGYALEAGALERTARYLGAQPVERDGEEDYLLEIVVREYGIDAEAWESAAYFYIEADAFLLDAETGTEIWSADIDESDAIGPRIWGGGTVRNAVTAASLADLSVDEIVVAFESLADYAATEITARLSEDLRDARR